MKVVLKTANFGITFALIVAAIGLVFFAAPYFGNKALIVRSASMQPTIPVGGLVVVHPEKALLSPLANLAIPKYQSDQIVAFKNPANSKIITTHRIVAQELKEGKIYYQTKGDANKTADSGLVSEVNVVGKSRITIPFVGKLVSFTKSNIGFPLMVIFPAVLVIIFESFAIFKELRKTKELKNPISSLALKIVVIAFLTIVSFSQTFAFFSDSETSTGNTFTAAEEFDE